MNAIRFSDLCAQGLVAGKRVFIRADLNVPQDDAGHITEGDLDGVFGHEPGPALAETH